MGILKPMCCNWAHSEFSEVQLLLCDFQQEGVRTIFLHWVNSHGHVLSWYDAGVANATGWRWQWRHHSPAGWGFTMLRPPRPHLPQSAFTPGLDQMHSHRTPGSFTGHQDCLTYGHAVFSCGNVLRAPSFYHLYHRICLSCKDKSSLPSQKLIVTCCSRYGRKWIIGLFAMSQRAEP